MGGLVNPGIPGISVEERNLLSPGGIRTPDRSTQNLVTILIISRLPGSLEGERGENERTQYVNAGLSNVHQYVWTSA